MNITLIFFLGLIIALVGVIPPGLLNVSAAKISLKEGYSRGIVFSIGVCITVAFQTYIAIIFARYLSNHPDIVEVLKQVALVIFILITIYYFFFAKKDTKADVNTNGRSKKSRLFLGIFMSAINVFPIPYQAYMGITLATFGLLNFEQISIISYVAGAMSGTFVMLYIYIFFFERIKNKKFTTQKNMNYLIGGITGAISIVTLISIIMNL
ncbi:lysine transporter LysE [Flavobacteriaceae bacterium AU392]|nr:lysine transporter LysE [Flavobacteriaceae bacterium]RKM85093.1 lysine transporter LysE [Flavobacteriaceae bacterium AU392]